MRSRRWWAWPHRRSAAPGPAPGEPSGRWRGGWRGWRRPSPPSELGEAVSEAELWKYLAARQDDPPTLRVVLPAALGESVLLRKLTDALDRTRHMLTYHLAVSRRSVQEAKDKGNEAGATLWSGQVLGMVYALERLSGDLLGELGLWDQQEKQTPEGIETLRAMADQLSWSIQRPPFPLPDSPDPTLGLRLALLIRAQRDELVGQAVAPTTGRSWSTPGPADRRTRSTGWAWAVPAAMRWPPMTWTDSWPAPTASKRTTRSSSTGTAPG